MVSNCARVEKVNCFREKNFMIEGLYFIFKHFLKCLKVHSQNAVKIQSNLSQNEVEMQSKFSQNSDKMQSKFSQNSVKIQPKCSQNSVTFWSAYRLKSFQSSFSYFDYICKRSFWENCTKRNQIFLGVISQENLKRVRKRGGKVVKHFYVEPIPTYVQVFLVSHGSHKRTQQ